MFFSGFGRRDVTSAQHCLSAGCEMLSYLFILITIYYILLCPIQSNTKNVKTFGYYKISFSVPSTMDALPFLFPPSPSPEATDMISTDGADIPDIAVTACQTHGVTDRQAQIIKHCLKVKMTPDFSHSLEEKCSPVSNKSQESHQLTCSTCKH